MDNKKKNFQRISENRVSKIILTLKQLTNLTNTSFYEYENEEIEILFKKIEKEVKNTKEILIKANGKNKKFELSRRKL